MSKRTENLKADVGAGVPDRQVSVRELFGVASDMKVPAFSQRAEHVPEIDEA